MPPGRWIGEWATFGPWPSRANRRGNNLVGSIPFILSANADTKQTLLFPFHWPIQTFKLKLLDGICIYSSQKKLHSLLDFWNADVESVLLLIFLLNVDKLQSMEFLIHNTPCLDQVGLLWIRSQRWGHIYCCSANFCEILSLQLESTQSEIVFAKDFPAQISQQVQVVHGNSLCWPPESCLFWKWLLQYVSCASCIATLLTIDLLFPWNYAKMWPHFLYWKWCHKAMLYR